MRFTLVKLGKLDYLVLKAYDIINLLNYLGKVNKRILVKRLRNLANTSLLPYN